VWRVSAASETRAVDVAIAELRKKLGPGTIVSIRGVGYRWGELTNG
jgi:DNA-binding response OmpR family regulator